MILPASSTLIILSVVPEITGSEIETEKTQDRQDNSRDVHQPEAPNLRQYVALILLNVV